MYNSHYVNYGYPGVSFQKNSTSDDDSPDNGSDVMVKKPKRSRLEQSGDDFSDAHLNFSDMYKSIIYGESNVLYEKQFLTRVFVGSQQNNLNEYISELLSFTNDMKNNSSVQNAYAAYSTNVSPTTDSGYLMHSKSDGENSVIFLLILSVSGYVLLRFRIKKSSFLNPTKTVVLLAIFAMSYVTTPAFADQSTLDPNISSTTAVHEKSGHTTVCITNTTCYAFYIKSGNTLAYAKTTNGGITWDSIVTIDSTQTWLGVAIWYDRWTPGDITGNLIHFAAIESGTDRIWYGNIDTGNGDALTGPVQTIPSSTGGLAAANDISITKATDGKLYVGTVDATAPTSNLSSIRVCASSCSSLSSWSSAGTNPWDGSTTDGTPDNKRAVDSLVLLPLAGGNIMILDHDNISGNSDHVKYNIYSVSTNSTNADFTDIDTTATYNTGFPHTLSGTVDPTTNTLYISYVTDAGTADTSHVKAWKYVSSWTALTDPYPATSGTSILDSSIAVSSDGGSLYVTYIQDPNPSTSSTDRNSYSIQSVDGGSTWDTSSLLSTSGAGNIEGISADAVPQSRVYAVWANLGTHDLVGNTIFAPPINNSVHLSDGITTQDNASTYTSHLFSVTLSETLVSQDGTVSSAKSFVFSKLLSENVEIVDSVNLDRTVASITIDPNVSTSDTAHEKSGHTTVCITNTTCYAFYIKSGNTLAYAKTTNGGITWDSIVTIDSTQTWLGVAIWYDRWTPGDITGNLIHFAAIESGTDRIWYGNIDTGNGDALTGPVQTIPSSTGGLAAANDISITKATDGKLYVGTVDATAPTSNLSSIRVCASSCSSLSSWSSAGTNPWDGSTTDGTPDNKRAVDSLVLLPLAGGNIMILDHDNISGNSDHVKYNIYSVSTNSTNADFTDIDTTATYNTGFPHTLSGTVDPTTNTLYISYVTDAGTADTSHVKAWKYVSSWTALTDPYPATSGTSILDSSIAVSSDGGSLYVTYIQDPNPSTSSTDRNSYSIQSVDGGSTWDTSSLLSTSGAGNIEGISADAVPQSRVYAVWTDVTKSDLIGTTVSVINHIFLTLYEDVLVQDDLILIASHVFSLNFVENIDITDDENSTIPSLPSSTNISNNLTIQDQVTTLVISQGQQFVNDTQQQIIMDPTTPQLVVTSNTAALTNVTIPATVTNPVINYSSITNTTNNTTSVQITNPITITKNVDDAIPQVQVTIPAGTTMQGMSWDGVLVLPTIQSISSITLPASQNLENTPQIVVKMGSTVPISFDNPVRILFAGQAGSKVGFFHSTPSVTEITSECLADDISAIPIGSNECKMDVGSDLIVWTNHFTGFTTWTSSVVSTSSGTSLSSTGWGGSGVGAAVGTGASSTSDAAGAGPYLRISKVSYDVCTTKEAKIEVDFDATDVNPTVMLRTSITGIADAKPVLDQPFAQENLNGSIKKLVYEASLDSRNSFEVLAMEAVGHNVFSVGKTIDVNSCSNNVVFGNIENMSTEPVDVSLPMIFDVKLELGDQKINSNNVDNPYVDSQPVSVYAIVNSMSPITSANLKFVPIGNNMTQYDTIPMNVSLSTVNSTYLVSGTIPQNMLQSPAISYWITVQNQQDKSSSSEPLTFGVKPSYNLRGTLELDTPPTNVAEGSETNLSAYYNNTATGPVFGTISLLVDGNTTYVSSSQVFSVGQTRISLPWKSQTAGMLETHHLQAVAQFYDAHFESDVNDVYTYPQTKTVSISQLNSIDLLKDDNGTLVASPKVLHSSYVHEPGSNYQVISPDGTCVIGVLTGCLVNQSTYGLDHQTKSVTIGDQIYQVRYSGPDDLLERFTISSTDPILGMWKTEMISSNGTTSDDSTVLLQIKYFGDANALFGQ